MAKASDWANKNPQQVAELLSPQLGVPAEVLLLATERRSYNAEAINPTIITEQQKLADTFVGLGLIQKPFKIDDAVYPVALLR